MNKKHTHELKNPKNPIFGVSVTAEPPTLTCCGSQMRLTNIFARSFEFVGKVESHYQLDCIHCSSMFDVKIETKQREGCSRCGGGRCGTDDGHLGDDGGYLA